MDCSYLTKQTILVYNFYVTWTHIFFVWPYQNKRLNCWYLFYSLTRQTDRQTGRQTDSSPLFCIILCRWKSTLISVVDVVIIPMNPYQPIPFHILSFAVFQSRILIYAGSNIWWDSRRGTVFERKNRFSLKKPINNNNIKTTIWIKSYLIRLYKSNGSLFSSKKRISLVSTAAMNRLTLLSHLTWLPWFRINDFTCWKWFVCVRSSWTDDTFHRMACSVASFDTFVSRTLPYTTYCCTVFSSSTILRLFNEQMKKCKSVNLLFFSPCLCCSNRKQMQLNTFSLSSLISRIRNSVVRCCLR